MAGTAEVGVAETYDMVSVSGLSCTSPKGTQAPGNVCPIPFVPMIGFTRSTTLVCAIATVELAARKRQHIDFLRFIMSYQLVRKG